MAAAFGLGSYLDPRDSDVPGNAAMVVAFDTGVAVVAGLVLFPALFAFGMDPDQGAGLLFVTMTALFHEMPGGGVFGAASFFFLLVAGFTFRDETNRGTAGLVTVSGWWRPLIRFVIPVAVSLVLLGAFGVGTGNPVVFLGWSSVVIALHVVLFLRRAPD